MIHVEFSRECQDLIKFRNEVIPWIEEHMKGRFESIEEAIIAYGISKGTFNNHMWKRPTEFYRIKDASSSD